MVWNSTHFFFPAFLLLFFLPDAPLGVSWSCILSLSLFLTASSFLRLRKPVRTTARVCVFILLLLGIREQRFHNLDKAQEINLPESEYTDLEGSVSSQIHPWPDGGYSFLLQSRSLRFRQKKEHLSLTFQVHLAKGPLPDGLARGSVVALSARLNPLKEHRNFAVGSRRPGMMARGIDWLASCKSSLLIEVVKPAPLHWRLLHQWRERLNQAIERLPLDRTVSSLSVPLFKSIFLGHPFLGEEETRYAFMASGALHLVAISGTHIALVTGFTLLLLFWAPPGFRRLICCLVVLFYLLQAAGPVSAQRAAIAAWAFLWAAQRKRKLHLSHILGLAGCLELLVNPLIVHSPGFILSYAICFSLVFWAEWLGFKKRSKDRIPFSQRFKTLLKTQILAFAVSSPLTLHFFNQTTLVSVPAGLLLIPLFGLLLPVAAATLLLYMALPASVIVTGHLLNPLVGLLQEVLNFFSRWDSLVLYRHCPPGWAVFIFLGLLLASSLLPKGDRRRRIAILSLLGILLFLLLPDRAHRPPATEIHAPDIGQGELTALVFPDGSSMLIDCGGSPQSNQRGAVQRVSAYLLNNRIHPRWIAVSHFHSDHCGTLPDLIRIFKPEAILVSQQPQNNPYFIRAQKAGGEKTRWVTVTRGHTMTTEGARLAWLYPVNPAAEDEDTRNGHSQVIRMDCEDFSMLFCGDIGAPEEILLLNSCAEKLDSDILKVPHHGSKGSSSAPFLDAVSPGLALFHCGRNNPFHFPHSETLSRYRERGIPAWQTWQGGIVITVSQNRVGLKSASGRLIPGFHALVPSPRTILDF